MRARSLSRRAVWILGVTLSVLASSGVARADDEAVTRFERGVQLYEAENYEGALVEFQTAYNLSNNYKLLYNIGVCQNALKDYPAAAESFTKYLQDGAAELTEARRKDVEERLAKLSLMVTRVRVSTDAPEGATLLVDGEPAGTTPLPEAISVKIGRRQFSITAQGKTVTKTVDVTSGDQQAGVRLMFSELAPPPPAAVPPDRGAPTEPAASEGPSFPWAFWGLTVVLGGAAGVTGALAVDARNDMEQQQATFGVDRAALDDARSKTQTLGIVTDVLLAGSVLSLGLSTYLTVRYFGAKKTPRASASGITFSPTSIGYMRSF